MSWAADDRWKDGSGGIVSGETGLAHTGAIVHNKSGNFVVTHICLFRYKSYGCEKGTGCLLLSV